MAAMDSLVIAGETFAAFFLLALALKMKGKQLRWFRFVLIVVLIAAFIVQQILEATGVRPVIPHFATILVLAIASYIASDRWQKGKNKQAKNEARDCEGALPAKSEQEDVEGSCPEHAEK
ncbi:MAG: hypothetical protein Q4G38_03140 [Aeriscardovia aeriphila]|nr:hypothetical protein [Aeriscardovia aeriphila]